MQREKLARTFLLNFAILLIFSSEKGAKQTLKKFLTVLLAMLARWSNCHFVKKMTFLKVHFLLKGSTIKNTFFKTSKPKFAFSPSTTQYGGLNFQLFLTFLSIKASFLHTFFTDHNISPKFKQLHIMNFQLLIILCCLSQTFGDGPCIYEHHYCNPTAFDLIRKVTEVIIEDRSECEAKCTE